MKVTWSSATLAVILNVLATSCSAAAQESKPTGQPAELGSSETTFTIHAERNVVVVRVVVRDRNGKAVTGLRKEDFRLFDNGKPQTIGDFSVGSAGEKPAPAKPAAAPSAPPSAAPPAAEAEPPVVMPDRFTALFFDDIHVAFEDLVRTRDAADRYLSTNLRAGDRAGIFTSSGQNQVDFTADRQKLHDALFLLRSRPLQGAGGECPEISEYLGYLIVEQDPLALQVAQDDALYQCCGGNKSAHCPQEDPNYLQVLSQGILTNSEMTSRYVFQGLEGLCRRMALLRGQRSIVLISPGFFTNTVIYQLQQVIDRALRDNVVIGTFDARGLYVDIPGGNASQQMFGDPQMMGTKVSYHSTSNLANIGVLASLASETGGVYYHDSNDYDAGFLRTAGFPEASYVLTFSPQNLKFDGSFHKLKVTLANASGLTLQARHGYYAPRKAETMEDEIEEMVLSSDEVRELPAVVNTSFFKTDNLNATLSVVARVNVSSVQFQKQQDRNLDTMTLVAVLFDSDGNYVTGTRVNLDMQFHDTTLSRAKRSGVLLKATLKVKVGTYLMRVVIRDSGSARLAGLNQTVEIPL